MSTRTLVTLAAGAILGFSAALATNTFAERTEEAVPGLRGPAVLPWEEARLLAEVFERIKRNYVDNVDDHRLLENAVRGMVASLDPHSAFLDNDEFEEIRLSTMGSYPGVGIEVAAEGSAVKILHAIEGSPADRAGMRAGDLIAKIDGVDVGADVAGAIARMSRFTALRRRPSSRALATFASRASAKPPRRI